LEKERVRELIDLLRPWYLAAVIGNKYFWSFPRLSLAYPSSCSFSMMTEKEKISWCREKETGSLYHTVFPSGTKSDCLYGSWETLQHVTN